MRAVALMRPKNCAWLFVSLFIAASAMLNPSGAVSMASTLIVVPLNVSAQHVPQFAESKPSTANAPPMFGKPGSDVKFEKPARSLGQRQNDGGRCRLKG